MSNSLRCYRAILTKLVQLQGYPNGRMMQRVPVLAGVISGIVGSRRTHGGAVGYLKIALRQEVTVTLKVTVT